LREVYKLTVVILSRKENPLGKQSATARDEEAQERNRDDCY